MHDQVPGLSGKQLELLKESPSARGDALCLRQGGHRTHLALKRCSQAASALGLELHFIELRSPARCESVFSEMTGSSLATALFYSRLSCFHVNRKRIADFATRADCQRCTRQGNLRRPVFSCRYGPTVLIVPSRRGLCRQDPEGHQTG